MMNYSPLSVAGAELDFPRHVELEQAREILLALPVSTGTESAMLDEALDRVLAQDAYAFFPMPPFDRSPFDGYAFRSEDTPGRLNVIRTIAAGDGAGAPLREREAVRIFTGAPVPAGANVVAKQEDTRSDGPEITVYGHIKPDTNVIKAGEDYPAGKLLARAGERLTPAVLGVLASQGYYRLNVYKKPRAVIISTGSELFEPGEERREYGIYNSSYYTLAGYLRRLGLEVVSAGTVEDDPDAISGLTAESLKSADMVITTGGASVGDYDYALYAARCVGARPLFWKLNMKPGGAMLAAEKDGRLLLSLSGNPAAAIMGILAAAQPYLRKLCGLTDSAGQELTLPLKYDLPKTSSATRLLRGHLEIENGLAYFAENTGRGNGNILSFENCEAIALIPGDSGELTAGTMVNVLRLPRELT